MNKLFLIISTLSLSFALANPPKRSHDYKVTSCEVLAPSEPFLVTVYRDYKMDQLKLVLESQTITHLLKNKIVYENAQETKVSNSHNKSYSVVYSALAAGGRVGLVVDKTPVKRNFPMPGTFTTQAFGVVKTYQAKCRNGIPSGLRR